MKEERGYDRAPDLEAAQERYFKEPLNYVYKKIFEGYVEVIQERNLKEHVEL